MALDCLLGRRLAGVLAANVAQDQWFLTYQRSIGIPKTSLGGRVRLDRRPLA